MVTSLYLQKHIPQCYLDAAIFSFRPKAGGMVMANNIFAVLLQTLAFPWWMESLRVVCVVLQRFSLNLGRR